MEPLSTPDSPETISPKSELSEREREILRLVATGASNKEIAQQLVISPNTVKVHLRNIFGKIGVVSRTEATVYAIRQGWVQVDTPPANAGQTSETVVILEQSTIQGEAETLPLGLPSSTRASPHQWWLWAVLGATVFILILVILFGSKITAYLTPPTPTILPPTPVSAPRWQFNAPLPEARTGVGVTTYEGLIYVVGGEASHGATGRLDRYDPTRDQWMALPAKPISVTEISVGVVGGQIYVPGGRLSSGQITTTLEVYDPQAETWTQRAPLPAPRSAYALVTFEGRLYLFGGWNGQDYMATTYSYDPRLDTWQELTPMPTARAFAGAAVAGDKIYVIGGRNQGTVLDVNEAYSPNLDQANNTTLNPWQQRASLPSGQAHMKLVALADVIYLLGGEQSSSSTISALEYFATQDVWQGFDTPGISVPWFDFGLTAVDSRLYIIGGTINSQPTDRVLNYQAIFTVVFPIIQQ